LISEQSVKNDKSFAIANAVSRKCFVTRLSIAFGSHTQIKFEKPFLALHFVGLTSHTDNNADSPSSMGVDRHTQALHTAVAHDCL
jgi:hypothetical protein